MKDWIKANEMKFTKENLQKVKEAAAVFVATVKPEKDETTYTIYSSLPSKLGIFFLYSSWQAMNG